MKAEDNPFPSVLLVEQGSAPASPTSGDQRLYIDTNHTLESVDSAGNTHPHAPILLLAHGVTTPPAGTAAGTILLQKA